MDIYTTMDFDEVVKRRKMIRKYDLDRQQNKYTELFLQNTETFVGCMSVTANRFSL